MRTQIKLDLSRTLVIEPAQATRRVRLSIKLGGVVVGSFCANREQCAALDKGAERASLEPGYRDEIPLEPGRVLVMEHTAKGARFALKIGGIVAGAFVLSIDQVGVLIFGIETAAEESGISSRLAAL